MKTGKTIGLAAGTILAAVLLRSCVAVPYLIPSSGMENSLYRGERILVNRWSYGLRLPFMAWLGYHRWGGRPVGKDDIIVFNNPANLKEPVADRREVFINRCIGIPGDTLLTDSLFSVVPSAQDAPDQKFLYACPRSRERQLDSLLQLLHIKPGPILGQDSVCSIRSFSRYEAYLLEQSSDIRPWIEPLERTDSARALKPLVVPGRGKVLRVHPWNRTLLCNTLVMHEHRQAEIRNDTLFVDGKPAQHCYFTKDYYWVVSNNPANLSDSRLFGFVPEDHIIGKASLIWFSKRGGSGLFDGYRWERFGQRIR